MKRKTKKRRGGAIASTLNVRRAVAVAVWLAAGLTACAGGDQPLAPETREPDLEALLYHAIQDEYHAEAVYAGVLEDFGQVRPFQNIVGAEVRHSEAIARAYETRGWTVPASTWGQGNVRRFESVSEACRVGVDAEVATIEVYNELLREALPSDVVRIFTSNRAASLDSHLPAFQRCS